MTLRILHSSDIHGHYKWLLKRTHPDFDVWLDTGDFFGNVGRVAKTGGQILTEAERIFQHRFIGYKNLAPRFKKWLAGRPAILVPGNHDFVMFSHYLRKVDCPNVHVVTPEGVDVLGLRWAGFRHVHQVNPIPEWMGEVPRTDADSTFRELVAQTLSSNPDILVTHCPPRNILNGRGENYGISAITNALAYQPHKIQAHFFGHDHLNGGQQVEEMGVKFFNGACHVMVHELNV